MSQLLAQHRFAELFRDELGWDRSSGKVAIDVDDRHLDFEAVAQKRGFQVLQCIADRRVLFNRRLLRRAQVLLSKTIHEHILIYCCSHPSKQVWQWAVRMPDGRKLRHREHPFFSASPPASLQSRLKGLCFSLDEEADVAFIDALRRVRAALDVAPELNLFARRPWYAERSDELAVKMAQGDVNAFHAFILLHRPLARHIAKRIQRAFGLDADDAEQIGVIGLIQAAQRFDPERGAQFSTYATYWIRQVCQRYGPDAALLIRLPAHIVESFIPFRRQIQKLESEYGPDRANDELARLCAEDPRFFRRWLAVERALSVRSLSDQDAPEYHEARTLLEAVEDEPIRRELDRERGERIRAAMACLKERERRFLRLRYGLAGRPRTLEEIGLREGISRERVRQIQMVAEKKLRAVIEHKLRDLVPARVVGVADAQADTREGLADGGQYAESSQAGRTSNGPLASSGVSILAQEQPQLVGLDLERGQKAPEHVADAVRRQVAFYEQPVVNLEGLAK